MKKIEIMGCGYIGLPTAVTFALAGYEVCGFDINETVVTLKRYIDEAAARIDQELEYAKSIQLSAMPRVFPPYPDRNEFEIFVEL